MIPRLERGTQWIISITTNEFAEEGRLTAGFDCLLGGLQRAREAVEREEPWAAELVLGYHQGLDQCIARFGVPMG